MELQAQIELVVVVSGVAALILYRLKKKFKNEKIKGAWDFLDQNIVEVIIGMVLVPDWSLILKLFGD